MPALLARRTSAESKSLSRKGYAPFGLRRRGGFRFFGELAERGRVPHRQIRQNLAVNLHAGNLQPVHKLAVGQPRVARGGADSLNPELAVLPLFVAAVAIGITLGAIDGLLRRLVQLALCEIEAFCAPEIFLAARAAFCAAFYASHGVLLFCEETNIRTPFRHAGMTKRVCLRCDF